MDDGTTDTGSPQRDHRAELARMSHLVRKVHESVARTLVDANVDATDEQRLDIVARIFGYPRWRKMYSNVLYGGAKTPSPSPMAAKALVDILGVNHAEALHMAARISDQYDDRYGSASV